MCITENIYGALPNYVIFTYFNVIQQLLALLLDALSKLKKRTTHKQPTFITLLLITNIIVVMSQNKMFFNFMP